VPAIELRRRPVERIWGRTALPPPFDTLAADGRPVGEIWFEAPGGDAELLVKYLFTAERLSIQVHPDAEDAARRGLESCKDEAWLILDAEPGASIGLGLTRAVGRDALRAAAVSGAIEELVDWRTVRPGEILYSPAGTIHAIGAGLSLIEIQQNCDVTYRLYDYGRPRALQIEDAVSAARLQPHSPTMRPREAGEGREIHVEGGHFVLERWRGERRVAFEAAAPVLLIPLADSGTAGGRRLLAGTVWTTEGSCELCLAAGADLLVAYGGAQVRAFDAAV